MQHLTKIIDLKLHTKKLTDISRLVVIIFCFVLIVAIFIKFPPSAVDWRNTFYPVSQNVVTPYEIKTFVNSPWASLILFPLSFFSKNVSTAINASINLIIFGSLVYYKKGSMLSLFLTLTSFPFLTSLIHGTIEWIPALGFFIPNALGIFLILTKPQSGIFVAIDWFFRQKKKISFIILPSFGVLISLIIWGIWPLAVLSNMNRPGMLVWDDLSVFPWLIPVGILVVFHIIKNKPDNGELLGTFATFCFSPYFAPHSLVILFALLSAYYPKRSIIVWVILWIHPMSQLLPIYIQSFNQ